MGVWAVEGERGGRIFLAVICPLWSQTPGFPSVFPESFFPQRLMIGKSLLRSNLNPYCCSFLLPKAFESPSRNMKSEAFYNPSENSQLSES